MLDLFKRTVSSSLTQVNQPVEGEHQLYLPDVNTTITYLLTLSKRRTSLSIEIKQNKIQVKAPYYCDIKFIESFLLKKQRWVIEKQHQQLTFTQNQNTYDTGSKLLLFGEWITLNVTKGSKFSLSLNQDSLFITIPSSVKNTRQYVRTKLIQFYTDKAQEYVTPKFEQLQTTMQLSAKELQFKLYKRRWGCCYTSGIIRINPMLMGAPHWVIDCVLIHELCHLTHMNHSRDFWNLNKQFCPNCDSSKQWLFKNNQALSLS